MWAQRAFLWALSGLAMATTSAAMAVDDQKCSRVYWSGQRKTKSNSYKPRSLRNGACGRTGEGAAVLVHVQGKVPTASFFSEVQSEWTSSQAFPDIQVEGAFVGATGAPEMGDGAGGDIFALFGGQSQGGEYSKEVLRYVPSSGWSTLSNKKPAVSPRGRVSGTLTGVGSAADGSSKFMLLGGMDDEGDFGDAWLMRTHSSDNGYTWKELMPTGNSVGFGARSGHAATRWAPATDSEVNDRSRVVVFGGCKQQGEDGPSCMSDVWIATVPTKETAHFSMVTVPISADSASSAPAPVQGATVLVHRDVLYVYGGCSVVTATSPKVCSTQLRSISLAQYTKSESFMTQRASDSGVPTSTWKSLQAGTQNHGLALGGAIAMMLAAPVDGEDAANAMPESTMIILGGCQVDEKTSRSSCSAERQDVNLNGVCAGQCQNGATITSMGVCQCTKDFTGTLCDKPLSTGNVDCPKDCSGHGTCTSGKCQCDATYGGADCTQRVCSVEGPDDCSGHGRCTTVPGTDTPLCVCKGQYHGVICSEQYCSPRDCNGHGQCNTKLGKCDCAAGYGGAGCEKSHLCASNCTGHGSCIVTRATVGSPSSSRCSCDHGWSGKDCATDERCDLDFGGCGEHGHCVDNKCACDEGFVGKQCKDKKCPKHCSGHGDCDVESGVCKCLFGFVGDDCANTLSCPNDCSGKEQGICVPTNPASDSTVGTCKCKKGFSGDDCSRHSCPSSFTSQFSDEKAECGGPARGECDSTSGECICNPAYGGYACEFACPVGKPIHTNMIDPEKDSNGIGHAQPNTTRAQMDAASGACSGRGLCWTTLGGDAKCKCEPGTRGQACEEEVACSVPDCSGNGVCYKGKCLCKPGYGGEGCENEATCQAEDKETGEKIGKPCSGHGKCSLGKCFCDVGYMTPKLNKKISTGNEMQPAPCSMKEPCPGNCNGHGRCHNKQCFCATGWNGNECEKQSTCKNKCSGHGICFLDRCVCEIGYTADDCSAIDESIVPTKCEGGCNDHGECQFGKCFCEPGFSGPNCKSRAEFECPRAEGKVCAGNGECLYNKCFCMPGFAGKACEAEAKCPNDCSGHGTCANGFCYCKPPFRGADCNSTLACKDDCNSRGICLDGKCACVPGFKGETCSFGEAQCPNECSGHGTCEIGRCFCDPSWSGKGCSIHRPARCKNDCSDAGICHNGKCICEPGMIGEDCGTPMPCPKGCRKNGVCVRGQCYCRPGYSGLNCSIADDAEEDARLAKSVALAKGQRAGLRHCPNQCSHNGVCFDGECMCEAGYSGVDCATVDIGNNVCQNDCGAFGGTKKAHGLCWLGKCFCYPGFTGSDCTEELRMPCPTDADGAACSAHGECHYGRCFCDIGFAGKACATRISCPEDCSGKGTCIRGRCKCETGYSGPVCNSTDLVCPNGCSGNGACILGRCACNPGWAGMSCDQQASAMLAGKKERGSLSDWQATELAVSNPDAAMVVPIKQPSVDYTVPQGKTVRQDQSEAPNKVKFGASILPEEKGERTKEALSNAALVSKRGLAAKLAVEHPSQSDSSLIGGGSKAVPHKTINNFVETEERETMKTTKPISCTPVDCSSRGKCHRGRCFCDPGFGGDGCEEQLQCPGPDCSGNGECANGKCVCAPGFSGDACEVKMACPSNCNHHGTCKWGKCFCDIGFAGDSCEQETGKSLCPSACNANGLCEAGKCFCKSEFTGHDCSIKVDLKEASVLTASMKSHSDENFKPENSLERLSLFSAVSVIGIAFFIGLGLVAFINKLRAHMVEKHAKGVTDNPQIFVDNFQQTASKPFVGDSFNQVGSL